MTPTPNPYTSRTSVDLMGSAEVAEWIEHWVDLPDPPAEADSNPVDLLAGLTLPAERCCCGSRPHPGHHVQLTIEQAESIITVLTEGGHI